MANESHGKMENLGRSKLIAYRWFLPGGTEPRHRIHDRTPSLPIMTNVTKEKSAPLLRITANA